MSARRETAAPRTGEAGFSLVELLASIAIIALVSPALAGVVIGYLTTSTATQSRLSESHDVQFTTAYWQRDVASIGVRSYDPGTKTFPLQQSVGVPVPCALPAGSSTVATLAWTRYDPAVLASDAAPARVVVAYVTRAADGVRTLTRVRCDGSATTSTVQVADTLVAAPVLSCDTACTGAGAAVPRTVTLGLEVRDLDGGTDGYAVDLRGVRRQS